MRSVDINVDVGEGFASDDALLQIATSANVCCGAHAGSVELCLETVAHCRSLGLRVGAHPGVADRANMGRAPIVFNGEEDRAALVRSLSEQVAVTAWDYIKPHGALYNATARIGPTTAPVVKVLVSLGLPLMGMPGTHHEELAEAAGVAFIREGFADRAYLPEGLLVPRTSAGSVLNDHGQIADQVLMLAERVDSICVHGDSLGCVEIAALVRRTLLDAGYEVGS